MMTRRLAGSWLWACLLACGSPQAPTDAGHLDDVLVVADAGPDAALPHPGSGTHEVTVLDTTVFPGTPLAGASVAFDYPGGGRREATTDATGRVTFRDVDWTAGEAAVVAWAPGYGAFAFVGVTEGDATPCFLAQLHRTTHRVSGNLLNRRAPGDNVFVSASSGASSFGGLAGTTYDLEVYAGAPLFVVATEFGYSSSGRTETVTDRIFAGTSIPAATADVTADIDLGAPLAIESASGHVAMPSGLSTALATGARAIPSVTTRESARSLLLGAFRSTRYDAASDGFDYVVDFVRLPAGRTDTVVTNVALVVGAFGEGTQVTLPGYPTDAPALDGFLPSPVYAPFGATHTVHDPLDLDPLPAGSGAVPLAIFVGDPGVVYTIAGARTAVRRLVPPVLPSAADEATALAGPLGLQIALCVPNATGDCDRFSAGPLTSLF